jgi:hypothetical protein
MPIWQCYIHARGKITMGDPPHIIHGLSKYLVRFDLWPMFQGQKHENLPEEISQFQIWIFLTMKDCTFLCNLFNTCVPVYLKYCATISLILVKQLRQHMELTLTENALWRSWRKHLLQIQTVISSFKIQLQTLEKHF